MSADLTPAPNLEVDALVVAFNAHFKTTASPEAVNKLLGSPHVRAWYAEYRATRARDKALPGDWAEAGLTPQEWAEAQSALGLRREARAEAAKRMAAEAAKYDRAISAVNAECAARLERASSPMALALEGGYGQLSLAAQIRVESCGDPDARAAQLKTELASARKGWVALAREGTAPF